MSSDQISSLRRWADTRDVRLTISKKLPACSLGVYSPSRRLVLVSASLSLQDKIIIAAHELGHSLDHDLSSDVERKIQCRVIEAVNDYVDGGPRISDRFKKELLKMERRAWTHGYSVLDSLSLSFNEDRFLRLFRENIALYEKWL